MGLYDCICIYVFAWSNHLFKSMNQENFSPMKLLAKVVFGLLAYNYVKHDLKTGDVTHVGRRTNMEMHRIPNNGGL